MDVGQILYQLRYEKGIYQKEIAAYLKVSIGTVSNYEQGIHYPDLETLCKLAEYYGVTTDYLLGRTNYRHRPDQLDKTLVPDYTMADLVNTTIELPQNDVEHLVDYVKLLKLRNDLNKIN